MTPPRPPQPFGSVHSGIEAEDTPIPMASGRALAKHIVEEFRPVIEAIIRTGVANALVDVTTRLSRVEEWQRRHDERVPKDADITGSHNLVDLQAEQQRAADRVKRKLSRLETKEIVEEAIEKANARGFLGWMERHGWKAALAGALLALQASFHFLDKLLFGGSK